MDEKKFAIKETVSAEEVKIAAQKIRLDPERFLRDCWVAPSDCGTSGA